ncbi:SDR family oxidoreductase [Mycobacterium sp. MYCO198283]|uniref:SDR family oxidoreductase n=1 Tax=Mycobacterium sp. MYCO198283 TaxID=2883505 RepID=UPI001E6079DF|nr:SDR family oxidoreductase [Mycobacterium sp. MYCO198283]MCG5433953.1 SDR family oxidoreductase [Mycobacterium sp. MYCO198283]
MYPELFSVAGKTALITGGTSGIGLMIAEGYLRAGAKVYVSSRKPDACTAAAERLSEFGEVYAIPADVSTEDGCRALIDEVGTRESALHILVNNAGATWGASFESFPPAAFDKVLTLNVKSPFVLTQLAHPLLKAAVGDDDPARVINIGSIDGLTVPRLGTYSYSASKAGVHQLTRHLAYALAPDVLVNAIAPGPFPSKMMAATLDAVGDQLAANTPVKRIGRTEDMAAAAIYLASRASNFVTGAVLPVDGGLSTTAGLQL